MRRRTGALAGMLAVALAAGAAANAIDDNFLATGWHTVVRGDEGTDATVGNLQVYVHGATASSQLDDGDILTSPGTFLTVDVSYATTDSWHGPEDVVLIDGDGREFTEPSGFSSAGGVWQAGPDIWFRGTLLFEIPPESVDDLTLEVRLESSTVLLPTTVLHVPLTVTTTPEPLTLEDPTVLAVGER